MYYRDGLRFCLAGLNDLHQRKAARYYIDLMESEWEVLGPIMKVQAAALEYAVERGPAHTPGHGPSPEEQAIVHRILTRLREGYQCFGRAVDETRHLLSDEEPLPPTEPYKSFDLFAQTLSADNEPWKQAAQTEAAALFAVMDERRTVFFSALDKETDALFEQEQMAFFKAAYRFQRMVSEEIFMTEEITDAFERLRRELPSVDELPAEIVAERDILRGIAETVDIKIESIKESVYAFNADGVHLVNDFTAGSKDAGYDDTLNAYNQVLDRWMTEMPETSVDASTIFFEQCAEQEPFAEHRRYYEKREAEYAAKINKLLLNYKKDTLLYEVSTYEEILTYSVSRLRACAAEDVARSVVLLDETLAALEMILKKNNIQVIRPSPHTPFNGREHEVLVAEKQEGFAKAEIIKTINSGYRQKDIVILRANVIAAR